jgi:hypothetical protein
MHLIAKESVQELFRLAGGHFARKVLESTGAATSLFVFYGFLELQPQRAKIVFFSTGI